MNSTGGVFANFVSMIGVYGVLAWFACGALSSHVASEKSRCGVCWFIWGVLFGPMALLATVGLPDKSKPRGIEAVTTKTHVLCPQCDEPVRNEARKCRHCGSGLIPLSEQGRR